MEVNALPKYETQDNPTHCCPRFKPETWDQQELHFKDKLFVRAKTHSLLHIPLDMNSVYAKTFKAIEDEKAYTDSNFAVLSLEKSPWIAEHLFAVTKEVPGQEMVKLTGDFITKVFEGPYKNTPKWANELNSLVENKGKKIKNTYFFYTTCPKCAKTYGKNYVVGLAQIE